MRYGQTTPPTGTMSNGNQTNITDTSTLTTSLTPQTNTLFTKLIRSGGSVLSQLQLYLSTHISYAMNIINESGGTQTINIAYNGDIVNKGNYFEDLITGSGTTQL
jgi:hypothetical protein